MRARWHLEVLEVKSWCDRATAEREPSNREGRLPDSGRDDSLGPLAQRKAPAEDRNVVQAGCVDGVELDRVPIVVVPQLVRTYAVQRREGTRRQ